jgi:hypothetical protein
VSSSAGTGTGDASKSQVGSTSGSGSGGGTRLHVTPSGVGSQTTINEVGNRNSQGSVVSRMSIGLDGTTHTSSENAARKRGAPTSSVRSRKTKTLSQEQPPLPSMPVQVDKDQEQQSPELQVESPEEIEGGQFGA